MTETELIPAPIDPLDPLANLPPLTLKQQAWITHLFSDANLNPSEAVRLSYDATTQESVWRIASDNVRKLHAHVQAMMKANGMQPEEVLSRLSDLARTTMDDAIEVDEDGKFRISLKKAKERGRLHTVKKIKDSPKFGIELEMTDAQAALHDLAQIHKLFPERRPDLTAVQVNLAAEAYTPPRTHAERIARIGEMAMLLGLDECIAELQRRKAEQEAIG